MKRVILVRTQGPRNAGSIMRACANFGANELVLVAPVRPSILVHPEFEQMAHGVENVRDRIRVLPTLAEALSDCTFSVGFTARARGHRKRKDWRDVGADWVERCDDPAQRVGLVFGSEENGLTVEETDLIGELCFLPTAEEHTSLNLALAAGIVLYTLYIGRGSHVKETGPTLADQAAIEYLRKHLKHVLGGKIARSPAARIDIETSIDRIFTRAPVESRDARAWHKILRALDGERPPGELGVDPTPRDARRQRALSKGRDGAQDEVRDDETSP